MNWVGGFKKWPFLLTFSTVFMLTYVDGGSKKVQNVLTYYMDGPQETTVQSNFYFSFFLFCMDSGPYLPIGQGGNCELSPQI